MKAPAAPAPGLLLFAHGARDDAWAEPFRAVRARVQAKRPGWQVALAYLELMAPDLASAAAALAAAGCVQVHVVPLFLGTGSHVRRDLPQRVDTLRASHPGIEWTLHAAIGEHPDVIDAIAQASLDAAN